MAATLTLTSAVEAINYGGDTAQMIIVFSATGSGDTPYTFAAKGLRVSDWGKLKWVYDFDDALLSPGEYTATVQDSISYLSDLFFDSTMVAWAKTAQVTIKINGTIEFIGTVQTDSIEADQGEQTVTFTCDSQTDILYKQNLWVCADVQGEGIYGDPVNPFGYTDGVYYPITTLLEDIFQLVDPTITYPTDLIVFQDWDFRGWGHWPAKTEEHTGGILFTELQMYPGPLYFRGTGQYNVGEVLKRLAQGFCCFTGLVHKKKAFFKKLFYYNASNLQTLGRVLNRKFGYKYPTIDFFQTIIRDMGLPYPHWEFGQNTNVEGRCLQKDHYAYFVYKPGDWPNTYTQILAVHGGYTWYITQCKDNNLASPIWTDSGNQVAKFWWEMRNNLAKCRIDEITVAGLGYGGVSYDFLKDFNDDGRKYQPVSMEKDIANSMTTIEAIYLGEV